MKPSLENFVSHALAGMLGGPQALAAAVGFYAQQEAIKSVEVETELARRILADPNDDLRKLLNRRLAACDFQPDAPWASGTVPNTVERRARIYNLLQIGQRLRGVLDQCIPAYTGLGNILVDNPEAS